MGIAYQPAGELFARQILHDVALIKARDLTIRHRWTAPVRHCIAVTNP